jgi:LEA14-like dessication related protein
MLHRIAILACALLLSACAATGLARPDIQVVGAEVLRGDLTSQELRVRLHVTNPNSKPLDVANVRFEIELAGERFATGSSDRAFVVPPKGELDFEVTTRANLAGALLKFLSGGLRGDASEYRVVGTLSLGSGLMRTIPFEHRGLLGDRKR